MLWQFVTRANIRILHSAGEQVPKLDKTTYMPGDYPANPKVRTVAIEKKYIFLGGFYVLGRLLISLMDVG